MNHPPTAEEVFRRIPKRSFRVVPMLIPKIAPVEIVEAVEELPQKTSKNHKGV